MAFSATSSPERLVLRGSRRQAATRPRAPAWLRGVLEGPRRANGRKGGKKKKKKKEKLSEIFPFSLLHHIPGLSLQVQS